MYNNGVQAYRTTNVITADPKRLVIMCYEGAIENLKIGKEKLLRDDYEGKCDALVKAQDIINELLCSLDFEKGGSLADNLHSLYNYMLRRIMQGSVNKDVHALTEIIDMLNELLSAWLEVYSKQDRVVQPTSAGFDENRRQQGLGYMSV